MNCVPVLLGCLLLLLGGGSGPCHAQVTNPALVLNTTVNKVGSVYEITGGTRPGNGPNLFHNFVEFSVPTTDMARFQTATLNPELTISNILSRVTGGTPSSIFGTIDSVTYYPNANLFLMNPAGVIFGPNATLNVGSMATFTTAEYIRLLDEVSNSAYFYAKPADEVLGNSIVSVPPLENFGFLTAAPVAFGFLQANPVGITVQGSTLQVSFTVDPETGLPKGNSISLIGGDQAFTLPDGTLSPSGVTVTGATLNAPSGEINLVSVASPGEVLLPNFTTGPNINGQVFGAMGTISLMEGTFLDVSDNAFEGDGSGGTVRIRGGQFVMDGALVGSTTMGGADGATTAVDIDITGDVSLNNFSAIFSQAFGAGRSGDVNIHAKNVNVEGISTIVTSTDGDGPAGNVNITLTGSTLTVKGADDFNNFSNIQSISSGLNAVVRPGDTGTVTIKAEGSMEGSSVSLDNGGRIRTSADGLARAGGINLEVKDVRIAGGASIETLSTGASMDAEAGSTGAITIMATGKVSITGAPQFDALNQSRIANDQEGVGGNAGISIHAREFLMTEGGRIRNDTSVTPGEKVTVTADDSITISKSARIASRAFDTDVAAVELSAPFITLSEQGSVTTRTGSNKAGGAITMTGQTIILSGNSEVVAQTEQGSGPGGPIVLTASDSVFVSGGSLISSSNLVSGPAGPVTVSAENLVSLAGAGTALLSETTGSGNGGSLTVRGSQVRIMDGATMSAKSTGTGAAGSVTIQGLASPADSVMVANSSLLTSAANMGQGGSITVDATNLTLNNAMVSASVNNFNSSPGSTDSATVGLGNIALMSPTLSMTGGSIKSETTGSRNGGTITVNAIFQDGAIMPTAAQSATLSNGASISANSTGPANAGDLVINAGQNYTSTNSSVTTQATAPGTEASGGNITVLATDMVQLTNSEINASVRGSTTTIGGTIVIDPQFVILNNSQILATATQGQGGSINIFFTGAFLPDATSIVSASSQTGINGNVNIQSPISQAGGKIIPMSNKPVETTALLSQRCAALAAAGEYSSFVLAGRDTLPTEPGGWLASPLASLSEALTPALSQGERGQFVSVRRLPSAGAGTLMVSTDWTAGCGS